jgi:hypothetical protein
VREQPRVSIGTNAMAESVVPLSSRAIASHVPAAHVPADHGYAHATAGEPSLEPS